uniref:Uncharacterized protein n=1 Tax=Timema poppense TaxID=170557 RepID=A0A7R9D0X4_TIMPO|nr:unnamed protein product [Timema poppensis]
MALIQYFLIGVLVTQVLSFDLGNSSGVGGSPRNSVLPKKLGHFSVPFAAFVQVFKSGTDLNLYISSFDAYAFFQVQDWSYHRVKWADVNEDGYLDAVTARFDAPFDGSLRKQELLWLENPGIPAVTGWRQQLVESNASDVHFQLARLNVGHKSYNVVISAEFFNERLTIRYSEHGNFWTHPELVQVRTKNTRPIRYQTHLLESLTKPGWLTYQPNVSPLKREMSMRLRDELGEKNPYCYPVEGLRHNMRHVVNIFSKAVKKWEGVLPLHQRLNDQQRHKLKVLSLTKKYIESDSLAPTKLPIVPVLEHKGLNTEPSMLNKIKRTPHTLTNEHLKIIKEMEHLKILTTFREEEINKINKEMKRDQISLTQKQDTFMKQVNDLEKMFVDAADTSIGVNQQAAQESKVLMKKSDELSSLTKNCNILRLTVFRLLEKSQEYKTLQNFLYKVSQTSWKKQQHHTLFTEDSLTIRKEDTKLTPVMSLQTMLFEDIDSLAVETCGNWDKPIIFFKDVHQFLELFSKLETMSLTLLSHSKELEHSIEVAKASKRNIGLKLGNKIEHLTEEITKIKDSIIWEEEKAREFQHIADMYSYGIFEDVEQEQALINLNETVTDVYESCITKSETQPNTMQMLSGIERRYVTLLQSLSDLPGNIVINALQQVSALFKREELEEIERVRQADELKRLNRRLNRYLQPITKVVGKSLKPRFKLPQPKILKTSPEVKLTEDEVKTVVVDDTPGQTFDVYLVDLNRDGRDEILLTAFDKKFGNVHVYEIPDDFRTQKFNRKTIATGFVPNVLKGEAMTPGSAQVFYTSLTHERSGQNKVDWTYDTILLEDTFGDTAGASLAADLDGDGFTEIIAAGYSAGKVYVYSYSPWL